MNYNILVVEDEKNILDIISLYLEKENYNVYKAMDGEEALAIYRNKEIHLIILDLMIPKISGEKVCKTIRKKSNVPIIILTAKDDENSKIDGLDSGADDYVTKPFSNRELMSRVNALLRRSYKNNYKSSNSDLSFDNGRLKINLEKMIVKKDDGIIDLTANEFKILSVFINNPGNILSREQLIESAFGYEYEAYDRTIDSHIKNIRQKLEDNPKTPVYIVTVYGIGYKFNN